MVFNFFMILFKNIFADDDYDIHVSTAESSGTDETKTFNSLETKSRNLISSSQGNYLHGRAIRTIDDSRIATKTKANQKYKASYHKTHTFHFFFYFFFGKMNYLN